VPFAVVGAVALFAGIGIGASEKPKTVEVVKEVPTPGPTVTKTVEKEVPVTPEACLRYITLSEEGFGHAGDAMGIMSEALTAAGEFNVAAMNAANDKLKAITPKMNELAPKSNAAKAECKAAAK
jgi:hypothetical protein